MADISNEEYHEIGVQIGERLWELANEPQRAKGEWTAADEVLQKSTTPPSA